MIHTELDLIYVDLFAGGGGTSSAVHAAQRNGRRCAVVAVAVNHDENAIATHALNHPETLHFNEDITKLYLNKPKMAELVAHVKLIHSFHPKAKIVLWASLECTNFSKAKGGLPREADSRTLAHHLHPYIAALDPDLIQIENVEEFMSWGPLDQNGKPISKLNGLEYIAWRDRVCNRVYHFQYRILNSADFGAYTSRRRFFGQFAKIGTPIFWPEPTHSKTVSNTIFERPTKKWNAVRECLSLNKVGESIFSRKKPLVDATLNRIYAGLIKFVAGGNKEFLVKWNSMNKNGHYVAPGVSDPCPTVTVQNRLGVCFISKAFSGDPYSKNQDVNNPCGAITTIDHHQFITVYNGNGQNHSIQTPSPTVTGTDRLAMVFIDNQYGNGKPSDIERPCPTVMASPKQQIVSVDPWVMNTNFANIGASIEVPSQTITANRKWQYLLNPQFANVGRELSRPCFTLIARMDKMPPYLIDIRQKADLPKFIKQQGDSLVYEIYETDSEPVRNIKIFMAMYGIVDIKMRMLDIEELLKIMGFPPNYKLLGSQAKQKKMIGNAVEINVAKALVEATAKGLSNIMTVNIIKALS